MLVLLSSFIDTVVLLLHYFLINSPFRIFQALKIYLLVEDANTRARDVDITVICHSYVTLNIFIGTSQRHVVPLPLKVTATQSSLSDCVFCNATRHRPQTNVTVLRSSNNVYCVEG